jgi:hypothetical protein
MFVLSFLDNICSPIHACYGILHDNCISLNSLCTTIHALRYNTISNNCETPVLASRVWVIGISPEAGGDLAADLIESRIKV